MDVFHAVPQARIPLNHRGNIQTLKFCKPHPLPLRQSPPSDADHDAGDPAGPGGWRGILCCVTGPGAVIPVGVQTSPPTTWDDRSVINPSTRPLQILGLLGPGQAASLSGTGDRLRGAGSIGWTEPVGLASRISAGLIWVNPPATVPFGTTDRE